MKTSDVRKAIPQKVKLEVLVKQARCTVCGERLGALTDTEFDHRPPLVARPYVIELDDFDPPQNDPEFLEAVHADCHLYRTTGRRGNKRITSRGSDIGDAARTPKLAAAHEEFKRRILAREPGSNSRPPSRWPKRKMQTAKGRKTNVKQR